MKTLITEKPAAHSASTHVAAPVPKAKEARTPPSLSRTVDLSDTAPTRAADAPKPATAAHLQAPAPRGLRGGRVESFKAAKHAKEVSVSKFDEEVVRSDKVVLVDFFATWCGPCRAFEPTFEKIAAHFADNPRVKVVKVDIDKDWQADGTLSKKYGIRSVPTLMVFSGAEAARKNERFQGRRGENELIDFVNERL